VDHILQIAALDIETEAGFALINISLLVNQPSIVTPKHGFLSHLDGKQYPAGASFAGSG